MSHASCAIQESQPKKTRVLRWKNFVTVTQMVVDTRGKAIDTSCTGVDRGCSSSKLDCEECSGFEPAGDWILDSDVERHPILYRRDFGHLQKGS